MNVANTLTNQFEISNGQVTRTVEDHGQKKNKIKYFFTARPVTLIDTPGFGDAEVEEDLRTVRQMVDVLKNKGIYIFRIVKINNIFNIFTLICNLKFLLIFLGIQS